MEKPKQHMSQVLDYKKRQLNNLFFLIGFRFGKIQATNFCDLTPNTLIIGAISLNFTWYH
jgi:hypothetical protein